MTKAEPHTPSTSPIIGIVGGVGPHAGYDLALKILQETVAASDQDHLPVVTVSEGHTIGDRTSFLLGETNVNPGTAITAVLQKLAAAGVTVAGIPCNTAHAERIHAVTRKGVEEHAPGLRVVHMVQEVGDHIRKMFPAVTRVGLLSTLGTATSGVYQETLADMGLGVVLPDPASQEAVHASIYDPVYGIKSHSQPVSPKARGILEGVLEQLRGEGLSTVILGCTELPIAFPDPTWKNVRLIDATRVLARALIRETYPDKLKPE